MSLLHRVFLPALAVAGLGFLIACGGSSNNSTPPPSGGFSDTNFNGTYTFSSVGADINQSTGNTEAVTIAGTVTACGCSGGQISAGTVDVFDAAGQITGTFPVSATGSGYKVNADGTGTLTLNLTVSGSSPIQYEFAFVLTDAAHGLVSEYDQNGTGSGTIDLQPSAVTLSGNSYAFSLSGSDPLGDPLVTAGAFTLDGSGNIMTSGASAGVEDFAFKFPATAYAQQALSGVVTAGAGTNPGSATLVTTPFGSLTFDIYAVDSTHFKLIENDGKYVLAGDAFSQSSPSALPAATLSFSVAGLDPSDAPFASAGTFVSDGTSRISGGAQDLNDAGTFDGGANPPAASTFTGNFTGTGGGRFQLTLSGFAGGTVFAAYPSSGGVLLVEVDPTASAGITAGVAMAQNSPAGLVASQGYGINLTGPSQAGELDQIAQFNTTSSSLSGELYQNNFGQSNPSSNAISGTITAGSIGAAAGEIVFNGGNEGAVYYGVDSATSLVLGVDSSDVSLGAIEQQGSPTSTADVAARDVAARHLAMIKAVARARAAKEKKQQ